MRYRLAPVLAFLAVASVVLAANPDKVLRKGDTKALEGKIEKEDHKEVSIKMEGGASSNIPWDKVDPNGIEYGDAPLAYRDAKSAWDKGDKASAAELFAKAVDTVKDKPIFLAHCLYWQGVAKEDLGKVDEAIAVYTELLKAVPGNRYFKDAYKRLIECHLKKNDTAAASKAIETATAEAKTLAVEQDFIMSLSLKEAKVIFASGNIPIATGKFQAVAAQAGAKFPAIKYEAMLGVAQCQMKTNMSTAQGTYESITKEAKGHRNVLGSAWAGLGDCLLAQAQANGNLDLYRRAALSYLQTVVLFFPTEGASTADYESALVNGGSAFLFLAQSKDTTDKARELYAAQAKSLFQNLANQFPASSLKAKAEELRIKAEEELAKVKKP